MPALRRLALTCAGVSEGETCLIVTDSSADATIVETMATVLEALGADVLVTSSQPAQLPGDEPPTAIGAAMQHADVIFELTSVFIGSSPARQRACENGARYLTVPGLTWTTLRPGGPFAADFAAIASIAQALGERFNDATEFELTSNEGTRLRGSFAGHNGRPLWGVADSAGGYAAPPDIEVGASPAEGSAEGIVCVDGSLLFLGPDQLSQPIELHFREGRLVDLRGREAWRLEDALARADDERMTNLAEVSIGLNPHSRPGGSPLELEGIVGGAHVALGNNVAYGGSVAARSHIDCVLLQATLALDGKALSRAELDEWLTRT
jgi:leucyl aminopeptidase (aminopeptidase T)